ncbi:MAG: hypothetical protein Q8L34_01855 [Candidatus Woesearchaeota archaeon]|nr:hypothetical protein [Candidatus Woesearchaeota archaeon]
MSFLTSFSRSKLFLVFIFSLPLFLFFIAYLHDVYATADATSGVAPVNCGNIKKTLRVTDKDATPHWGSKCDFDSSVHCASISVQAIKNACQLTNFPQVECPKGCVAALTQPYNEILSCTERQRPIIEPRIGSVASCAASCEIRCIPKIQLPA